MESIKDILDQLKVENKQKEEEKSKDPQGELFDTSKYSTKKKNPFANNKGKYVSKEYQFYGLRLAGKLGDSKRATMYIKWAKEKPRAILEQAFSFAIDYPHASDISKLFMWKVKQLETEYKEKKDEKNIKDSKKTD